MQAEFTDIVDAEIQDTIEADPAEVRNLFAESPAERPGGPPPAPAGKGGYTQMTDKFLSRRDLSPAEKLVLARLARYAAKSGVAWMSMTTLANEVGMTRRRVIDVVGALAKAGEIVKNTRVGYRGANSYNVAATGAIVSPVTSERNVSTSERNVSRLVKETCLTGAIVSHKDTKKRQQRRDKKERARDDAQIVFPDSLDNERFRAKWDEYIEYRRERKLSKLVRLSINKQFEILATYPTEVAIAAVDRTIAQGYTGIFPKSAKPTRSTAVAGNPSKYE